MATVTQGHSTLTVANIFRVDTRQSAEATTRCGCGAMCPALWDPGGAHVSNAMLFRRNAYNSQLSRLTNWRGDGSIQVGTKNRDNGAESGSRDLGMLLVLVAICPIGLLVWAGLLFLLQWSVLVVWGVAVNMLPAPVIIATRPDLSSPSPLIAAGHGPIPAPPPIEMTTSSTHTSGLKF
jgi:hypothetical protein